MNDKKVEPIQADDIFQLADAINEFSKTHDIFSTQLINRVDKDECLTCLIWYNLSKPENIYEKPKNIVKEKEIEEPMTSKQWGKLKSLGVNAPKGTTKKEAIYLIKKAVGEQDEN